LNPDERSTAALIRNGLIKFKKEKGSMETSPGITMERIGLSGVLEKLPNLVLLSENGKDEIGGAKTFILGDDKDPTEEEMEILRLLPKIGLGKENLLSSACITLIHHLLDI
jgi:tRNA pseudouridine-54 N-methylase